MGAKRMRPLTLKEEADLLLQSAGFLRAHQNRLEIEGRAVHDPSDKADRREMMENLSECAAHCEKLSNDMNSLAEMAMTMKRVMLRAL